MNPLRNYFFFTWVEFFALLINWKSNQIHCNNNEFALTTPKIERKNHYIDSNIDGIDRKTSQC